VREWNSGEGTGRQDFKSPDPLFNEAPIPLGGLPSGCPPPVVIFLKVFLPPLLNAFSFVSAPSREERTAEDLVFNANSGDFLPVGLSPASIPHRPSST